MLEAVRSAPTATIGSGSSDQPARPGALAEASELVEFALDLATSLDPERTADLVALRVSRSVGAAFCGVYLADGEGALHLEGLGGDVLPSQLEPPPPVAGRAVSRGRVELAHEGETDDVFPHLTRSAVVAAVPIASIEGRLGAVLVGAADAGGDADAVSRFISAVAALAAESLTGAQRLQASSVEARRDTLTGLGNRRAFHEHLDAALAAGKVDGQPVALVLFDLDDFKQINDREGHLVGDSVLGEVARLTVGALRVGEEAFRMGGEEFAIVVDGGRDDGKRVAERVRRRLERKRRGRGVPSISLGVAAFPADAESREALIHKADLALYAAKERGKNATVAYHERLADETRIVHVETHRRREEEWWQKVLGLAPKKRSLADELGPGWRPQEIAVLAEKVGVRLGLPAHELRAIVLAAYLTELGKLHIPESVRRKHGPLNERDWKLVRESTELTARSLASIGYLTDVLQILRGCRERWDGTGYPDRLAGEKTALGARIVAVCDAFCAMTSARSYRPARTRARAILELRERSGTHFDPTCVRALLDEFEELGANDIAVRADHLP